MKSHETNPQRKRSFDDRPPEERVGDIRHSVRHRNLDLISAAGELPPIECWPELWVVDDEKVGRAKSILKKTLAPLASVKKPWTLQRLR